MEFHPFIKYKDALGVPGEGIHKYRFLNTAIADYGLAILLACFITYITKIPLVLSTILVLIIGIVLHMLFGVETNAIDFIF